MLLLWSVCRELSEQNTDTEAESFDRRLREREAQRRAAPAMPSRKVERSRQYETDL
jgi:hypothetical protein